MSSNFVPSGTTELSDVPQSFAPSEPIPVQAVDAGRTERLTAEMNLQNTRVGATTGVEKANPFGGLWSLVEGVMEKKMKAAKDDAMWAGMSRAAAGASVEELRAEQNPLLTFLGEDAPAVVGAQMHHSTAAVSRTVSKMYDSMSDTAGLTTEQAAAAGRAAIEAELSTMDSGSRQMAEQQFLEAMPKFMQAHAKARVGKINQDYVNSSLNAADAAAAEYQSTMTAVANKTVNSDALAQQQGRLLTIMEMRIPGQTEESVQRARAIAAERMLVNGQVNAYSQFRNSPMWGELSEEQQQALSSKENSATRTAALNNPLLGTPRGDLDLLATNLALGVADYMTDAEINTYIADGNAAHAKTPEGGAGNLFDQNDAIRLRKAREQGVAARAKAAAKSANEPPPVPDAVYAKMYRPGDVDLSMYKPAEVARASEQLFMQIQGVKDPKAKATQMGLFTRMMAHEKATVPPLLKERALALNAKVQAGGRLEPADFDSFQSVLTLLSDKTYGINAVNNITDGKAAYWEDFMGSGVDLNDPLAVQSQVNLQHQKSFAVASPADFTAAEKIVEDNKTNWVTGLFTQGTYDNLVPGQERRVTRELAERVAFYRKSTSLSDEQIMAHAQADVGKKLTVMAGVVVESQADVIGRKDQFKGHLARITNSGSFDQKKLDEAMKVTLGKSLLARGISTVDPTEAVDIADAVDIGGGIVMTTVMISRGQLAGRKTVVYVNAKDVADTYMKPEPAPKPATVVNPMKYKPSEVRQNMAGDWVLKD